MKKLSTLFRWLVISSISAICVMGGVLRADEPDLSIYQLTTEVGLENEWDEGAYLIGVRENGSILSNLTLNKNYRNTVNNVVEGICGNRVATSSDQNLPFVFYIQKLSGEDRYSIRDSLNHQYLCAGDITYLTLCDTVHVWTIKPQTGGGFYIQSESTSKYLCYNSSAFNPGGGVRDDPYKVYLYNKTIPSTPIIKLQSKSESFRYVRNEAVSGNVFVVGGGLTENITPKTDVTGLTFSPATITPAQAAAGITVTYTYTSAEESFSVKFTLSSGETESDEFTLSGSAYQEVSSIKELLGKPKDDIYIIRGDVVLTTYAILSGYNFWIQDVDKDGVGIQLPGEYSFCNERGALLSNVKATYYASSSGVNCLKESSYTLKQTNYSLPKDTVTLSQLTENLTIEGNPYLNKLVCVENVFFKDGGQTFASVNELQPNLPSYGGYYWIRDTAGDSIYVAIPRNANDLKDKQIPSKAVNITGVLDCMSDPSGDIKKWRLVVAYSDFLEESSFFPSVPEPVFRADGKEITDGQIFDKEVSVTITAEEGTTIRYTTDGSSVTDGSPVYSSPITLTQNTRLMARAEKEVIMGYGTPYLATSEMVPVNIWVRPENATVEGHCVFEENFEEARAVTGEITLGSDELVAQYVPGWSVSSSYVSPTAMHQKGLGIGSYITSPAIDLSQNEGKFYVALKVANLYGYNQQCLRIQVGDREKQFPVRYTVNTDPDTGRWDYVVAEFDGGTKNTQITFRYRTVSGTAYHERILIDSVRVYQVRGAEITFEKKVITLPAIATGEVKDTIRLSGKYLTGDYTLTTVKQMRSVLNKMEDAVSVSADTLGKTFVYPVRYRVSDAGMGKDTAILELKSNNGGEVVDSIFIYAETKVCPVPEVTFVGATSTTIDISVAGKDGVQVFESRQASGSDELGAWQALSLDNGTATLSGFKAGKAYQYEVRSVCASGYYSTAEGGDGMMPSAFDPQVTLLSPKPNDRFTADVPVKLELKHIYLGECAENPDTVQAKIMVSFTRQGDDFEVKEDSMLVSEKSFLLPSGSYTYSIGVINITTNASLFSVDGSITVELPKAEAPVFSPVSGTHYDSIWVSLSGKAGDTIHYSRDSGKTYTKYAVPFKLMPGEYAVKAFISNPRNENSDTVTVTYKVLVRPDTVKAPLFVDWLEEAYWDSAKVELQGVTDAAGAYYRYGYSGGFRRYEAAFYVKETTTVCAFGAKGGWVNSDTVCRFYKIKKTGVNYYMLTVTANDDSWGVVTGGGEYEEGATVTMTATPAAHYHFVKWSDGDESNPRNIIVGRDSTFTAFFAIDSFNVTVAVAAECADFGTVTGGGKYAYGAEATLTATPKAGYKFVKWEDDTLANPRVVVVTADTTFTAVFEVDSQEQPVQQDTTTYTITVVSNDTAMGTVTGGGRFKKDTTVVLSATAKTGYEFVKWNDEVTTATRNVKVVSDSTFTAVFKVKEAPQPVDTFYTITVKANDSTFGTVTGGGRFKKDTTVTIKAVPAAGYKFVKWAEDNVTEAERSVKVVSDATYTAVFEVSVDVEAAKSVDFTVYPNPNTGRFTVDVAEDALMEIYNAAGVCVQRAQVTAGQRTVQLHTAGLYFVKMTAHGRTTAKRIIVR